MHSLHAKLCPLVGMLAVLAGCSRSVEMLDTKEISSPLLTQAYEKAELGDTDGAIRLYMKALDTNPRNARAHLDLALLLDDKKKDIIRAIYHYERYLEIRPQTEKRKMIEDRIRLARASFSGTTVSSTAGTEDETARLLKENALLQEALKKARQQVAELSEGSRGQDALARVSTSSDAHLKPQQDGSTIATNRGEQEVLTYRVKQGDTLYSIAATVYNDPNKWKRLYDANRVSLDASGRLSVGQVLVIPQ